MRENIISHKSEYAKKRNRSYFRKWIVENLPDSLCVRKVTIGYGHAHYIYDRHDVPNPIGRTFGFEGHPIAKIWDQENGVTVYEPKYHPDFRDLLCRFERLTGIPTVLKVFTG